MSYTNYLAKIKIGTRLLKDVIDCSDLIIVLQKHHFHCLANTLIKLVWILFITREIRMSLMFSNSCVKHRVMNYVIIAEIVF